MKKSHNWVTLENPRNGKIQVRVCTKCGSMKSPLSTASDCKTKSQKQRSLGGWTQVQIAV